MPKGPNAVEHIELLIIAGVLFLGIFCQWVAWRLTLPAILPLLAAGFFIGPVMGWVHPQDMLGDLFFPEVSLLVAVILFEGALTLEWREVRTVVGTVRNLLTVGALVTLSGGAIAAHFILGMGWELSILFGALIVVTGPTVIAPLLAQRAAHGQGGIHPQVGRYPDRSSGGAVGRADL